MNLHTSPVALRTYQILHRIVFVIFTIGYIAFGMSNSRNLPYFILLSIPVIVPFFVKYIFTEERPIYLPIYIGSLLVFTTIVIAVMPSIGLSFLAFWLGAFLISLIIAGSRTYPENEENQITQQPQTKSTSITPEEIIQLHIGKASTEINRYTQKLKPLYDIHEKSQKFLSEVNERLNYPHLSESNKQTSLQLRDMLKTSNENYRLMIRFFEEARLRYEREKRNLEEKLGNLRIISFLNDTDRSQEIASIEKAALDIEFQKQLLKIENELPVIKAEMDAKAQLLSHDLKAELTETIERLKEA